MVRKIKEPPLLPSERKARALVLPVLVFFGAVLVWMPPFLPACAFRGLTGLPCGLCGGTRALRCAISGNWEAAFAWNALALPVFAGGLLVAFLLAAEAMRGRRILPVPGHGLRLFLGGFSALVLLGWTTFHAAGALKSGNRHLADPNHPVASRLLALLGTASGRD